MKNFNRIAAVAASMALGGMGVSYASAGGAFADPPGDGCPAAYQVLSVAALSAQGYQVPVEVDNPTSGLLSHGRPGNGDGLVCALPLGNRTTPFGGQEYEFTDDNMPNNT